MADLFKRAPRSPQIILDKDWILPMPPAERNSFSCPAREKSSTSLSVGIIKTAGSKLNNLKMNL